MYPVSAEFLKAIQSSTRHYYWTGTIATKSGTVYEFTEKEIVKGSGYISSQCCGSEELELGSVYATELGLTLFTSIDRYTLEGATINLSYHLQLPSLEYESIPMGIFEVIEANRTIKCVELKAYDYMLRFDKSFSSFQMVGTAYEFLAFCAKNCLVDLAQTKEEIEALPNGELQLSIYSENDIETYRDVLHYVGQVLGGFFFINRLGQLEFKQYGTKPVMTFSNRHRFTSSFSDFITRYTAISSTNMQTQIAEYYALEVDDGLTMNLGVNPFIQFGLKQTRETLCRNILADLAVIHYVPFDSDTIGNPALDIGDVLRFSEGHADKNQLSVITSMQCKIGGKHRLKGVGKNPRLSQAKSKNDKNISGLLSQIESGKIGIHSFTNTADCVLEEDIDTVIISMEFATNEETHAQFCASVIVKVEAEGQIKEQIVKSSINLPTVESPVEVEIPIQLEEAGTATLQIIFELNDVKVEDHQPINTWQSGAHTMLLYYPLEKIKPNVTNTFNVYAKITGGQGLIASGGCIASISGQSMAVAAPWDGLINLSDEVPRVGLNGQMRVNHLKEQIDWEVKCIGANEYHENVQRVGLCGFRKPIELEEEQ
ncbi:hypothetical protein P261_02627 [Lachnospiraceae bacterium TWA4]|nr:hypothetical protein P261_02627 [Lachnospiraceae bacterium TWA4]